MAGGAAAPSSNFPQWETDMLTAMGWPLTTGNYQALAFWAQSEGTAGSNNPLAVSGQYPGATKCLAQCGGSSPVYAYATMADGIAANTSFLQGSNYAGIRAAFQKDAGITAIWGAVNQSPWCKGCQGGQYPIDLFNALPNPTGAIGQALQAVGLGGVAGDVGGAVSGVTSVGDFLGKITSVSFWTRIGMGALGLALVGVGFVVFFEGTDTGKKITTDGVDVAAAAAVA